MEPGITVKQDSLHLEALIAKLKERGESKLLIEHLQTAAAYQTGAMPEECTHNLQMARELADGVSDKPLQGDLKDTIAGLVRELHPVPNEHWRHKEAPDVVRVPSTAAGLRDFFQDSTSSLGIFYPRKYVVAVFRSFRQAELAREKLRAQGLRPWELIAAPGNEMKEFITDMREKHSLWSEVMMRFSRLLDTEAGLVDRYRKWGRRGAGFLAVYSPAEEQAEAIGEILRPMRPMAMHWFATGYIQHLQ